MPGGRIRSGQFRHKVIIQTLAETFDNLGVATDTWSEETAVQARVEPLSAREGIDMRQVTPNVTHTVTMRHRNMGTERRLLVRKAHTALNGAINDNVTTVVVDTDLAISLSAPYRILVDSEIMIVTAGAGTTSWTVTRGDDGTTAASHLDNAPLVHLSVFDIQSIINVDEFDKQLVLACEERT